MSETVLDALEAYGQRYRSTTDVTVGLVDFRALLAVARASLQRHYEAEPSHRDMPPNWCPVCSAAAPLLQPAEPPR